MRLITYSAQQSDKASFVAFWRSQYTDPLEPLYEDNIGQPLTPERVHALYKWKNGKLLSALKRQSVERNYIAYITTVTELAADTEAAEFLARFPDGGAIWRIFWLHCWQPTRFPIFDQHVHRAMVFIEEQQVEEIPKDDPGKIEKYLARYLTFHEQFSGLNQRDVDRALLCYGRFIKDWRFP